MALRFVAPNLGHAVPLGLCFLFREMDILMVSYFLELVQEVDKVVCKGFRIVFSAS